MSYQISYHNLENYVKFYMLQLIIKNKDNLCKIKISILSKLLSSICRYDFDKQLLYKFFFSPNESTGFINPKFINLKNKFFNSIKLLLVDQKLGSYLLKYYYIIFCTFYTYHKSIKYLCIKVYNQSKISSNQKILKLLSGMQINNNSNIIELNNFISKLELQFKFSLNDDNNYNIVNNIANIYIDLLKKSHYLSLYNYVIFIDDKKILLSFLKNIYHLKKNIKYIK